MLHVNRNCFTSRCPARGRGCGLLETILALASDPWARDDFARAGGPNAQARLYEANEGSSIDTAPKTPRELPGNGRERRSTTAKAELLKTLIFFGVGGRLLCRVSGTNALITQRSLVQIQPPQPKNPQDFTVLGVLLSWDPSVSRRFSPETPRESLARDRGESNVRNRCRQPIAGAWTSQRITWTQRVLCPGIALAACPFLPPVWMSALW